MPNIAILNYWTKERSSDVIVSIGDKVISNTNEFDLTEGKEYEIIEIDGIYLISVRNDLGVEEIYTVEHFRKKKNARKTTPIKDQLEKSTGLSIEDVRKTKKYLESIPERAWFGSKGLTPTESDLFKTIEDQHEKIGIYKKQWIDLCDKIIAEVDKDGWCRLVITKEQALEMKEMLEPSNSNRPINVTIINALRIECSNCEHGLVDRYNYCPNCGKELIWHEEGTKL